MQFLLRHRFLTFLLVGAIVILAPPTFFILYLSFTPHFKTVALFSRSTVFCIMTENYTPRAYIEFYYQYQGGIQKIVTKTDCRPWDFFRIAIQDDDVIGESITIYGTPDKPIGVKRGNLSYFIIEYAEDITNEGILGPGKYIPTKFTQDWHVTFKNSNLVLNECRKLTVDWDHDQCIAEQAAYQKNTILCNELRDNEIKKDCFTWVENIKASRAK